MKRTALLLAAHGSRSDRFARDMVNHFVQQLAAMTLFDVVTAAYHHGDPTFATVLDTLEVDEVTVVPLMTSAGYFSQILLPRELARNSSYARLSIRQTRPVGTHRGIVVLVQRQVLDQVSLLGLDSNETSLAIVGHGTPRSRHSRRATDQLVRALGELRICRQTISAFLNDQPDVPTILDRALGPNIVVVPFFMTRGLHPTRSIPAALGLSIDGNPLTTPPQRVKNRLVVCTASIGTAAGIVDIIADLARDPTHWQSDVAA